MSTTNPFEVGCSEPPSVPSRLAVSLLVGVLAYFVLFLVERHVFHTKEGVVAHTVAVVGGAIAAALMYVHSEHMRPTCDMRDTFDFYTSLGAPSNVAEKLTFNQLQKTNSIYVLVVLLWVYVNMRRC